MKQNNALVSTALLSTIFDEKNQDNISLLIPFVTKIIYKYPNIREEEISNKMIEEYSFRNFPHAIVNIIIKRMKAKQIIYKEEHKFLFKNDISKSIELFDKRMKLAKEKTNNIINSLVNYFNNQEHIKMNYQDCRNAFAVFLDKNGYLLYEDINNSIRTKNKDRIQYHIGLFIKQHKELEDIVYDNLLDIIEGSLIANAIYVNIENDNMNNLSNLTCYFDTPFMLRVLEYKDPVDNESALELVSLLKEQKAKIKCFRHNFNEIENILEEFIKNYGKEQDKTLENLVIKNYSQTELIGLLQSLEDQFKSLEIEIVDVPEFKKTEYDFVIDENKLQENIEKNYPEEKKKRKIIENDVKSISAIIRIRKGKEYRKLEECPAIFVTTNNEIRRETNNMLKVDEAYSISPLISNIDLTAVIWLKSLSTHKNIPEMKLTENAMAALQPNINIRTKFVEAVGKLKSNKTTITTTQLHNLLCSNYYRKNLMEAIDGDPNRINPNLILKTYESTLEENKIIEKKSKILEANNEELLKELMEKEQNETKYKNNIYVKFEKIESKINKYILNAEKTIEIFVCLLLLYISFKYANAENTKGLIKALLFLGTAYSSINVIFPVSVFSLFNLIFDKLNSKLFVWIHNILISHAEREVDEIIN